jgi:uncharacterized protein involved in exopolysaccharide biosynthesis
MNGGLTEADTEPEAERRMSTDLGYPRDSVTLLDYWRIIRRYRWLIIACAIAGLGAGAAFAFLTTPVYKVDVVFVAVEEESDGSPLTALASQLGSFATVAGLEGAAGGRTKDEAVAILRSRAFTERFIQEQGLMPVLFYEEWDESAEDWLVANVDKIPSAWDAYELFDTEVRTISEDPITGLLTLSIEWIDRQRAADWANGLVTRLNEHMRERSIRDARKSLDYLNNELGKTSVVELEQAIYRLIETQINKIMLANVRDEYVFKIIDPAVVPDADEFVWPNLPLLLVSGVLLGLFVSLAIAFSANLIRDQGH